MKEYTPKQIKELEKNSYVYKVSKHKLYYTAKFKEDFWTSYQAGKSPRKILSDFVQDVDAHKENTPSMILHLPISRLQKPVRFAVKQRVNL